MQHVDLDSSTSSNVRRSSIRRSGVRVAFPHSSAAGTRARQASTSSSSPERTRLAPDSAEELLLVLEGEGEATVGDETTLASDGRS